MKKILISLPAILLLSACTPHSPGPSISTWNGLKLETGTKCPVPVTPTPCTGIGDTVANNSGRFEWGSNQRQYHPDLRE